MIKNQNKTLLVSTYNRFFPNISNIVCKHWSKFNIRRTLPGLFKEGSITAFKINRNLKELIASNYIKSEKVKRPKNTFTTDICSPLFVKNR